MAVICRIPRIIQRYKYYWERYSTAPNVIWVFDIYTEEPRWHEDGEEYYERIWVETRKYSSYMGYGEFRTDDGFIAVYKEEYTELWAVDLLGKVGSDDINAYPHDGILGDYYYIFIE